MSIVEDFRKELDGRLRELKPIVDEYNELVEVRERLGGERKQVSKRSAERAVGDRPRRRSSRRSGGAGRAEEAFALVKQRPGITIPEIADDLGTNRNYLYRLFPRLVEEGKVRKDGKGWVPA
ncbi:hypothetical protein AYO39_01385 [Actinobacteria bacterium SCGC AG-212-D09]|nr:hypothetical protein AYO39_01385 [Actinobacteria bacterium SCGC AG-212-D09]